MFKLGIYPDCWKDSVMIVLRKPTKPDYTTPNAYQPITLLNTMAKVLLQRTLSMQLKYITSF